MDLPKQLSQARDLSKKAAQIQYRDEFHTSNEIVLIWFDVLNHMKAIDTESVGRPSVVDQKLKATSFHSTR